MTNTLSEVPAAKAPSTPKETGHSIFRRLGAGLLLFSIVFCGILSASWTYILPRLTRVQLQGKTVELAAVIPYEQELRTQITQVEGKRNKIVLPVKDEDFDFVKRKALCYPLLEELSAELTGVAEGIGPDTVVFSGMSFDAAGTLQVRGDVRNVGPRSMTILAQFVEALEALPFVTGVTPPPFVRIDDAFIGQHSPFDLTLTLKADDICPALP
jgi:hypothetical protein